MAFSINKPADLLALKTEIATDPISMGYVPDITRAGVLDRLNDPALNVGGENINKDVEDVDIPEISAVIDSAEFNGLSAYDKEWVRMFINRPVNERITPYKAKLLSIFIAGSVSRNAMLALLPKPASRAEILFGVNTVITRDDWITSRDS